MKLFVLGFALAVHVRRLFCLTIAVAFAVTGAGAAEESFELKDGDRVLFIGDTFFEREVDYGHIETRLTAAFPERRITFRNLAWAADTPMGKSRASFDWNKSEDDWLKRVKEQIALVKPTVAFLSYGMTAALEGGEAGIPKFKTDLGRLMDAIEEVSGNKVRFVLLGPIAHELWEPEAKEQNRILKLYEQATREIATVRQANFVELMRAWPELRMDKPPGIHGRTDDGIHVKELGQNIVAITIERDLFGRSSNQPKEASDILRSAIRKKNELFFHRWRPANWTYLLGFRKHEQGQNAAEIPKFEPFIAEWEARIAKLRDLKHQDPATVNEVTDLLAAEKRAASEIHTPSKPQHLPAFTVADGFEVNLWAENPMLSKPIQMNFDERGRLWIASSETYPQIAPGQPARDKIIVLEDKDGNGVAETFAVFADGLLIPTGVLPDGKGGCYVAASHQLLHFDDANNDGKADNKKIVLSSFGTEDTHHNLHTLRWGYDGHLYMNQSIYTHSHVETPHGVARLNSGGIWRFDPGTWRLEIFTKGGCNPWGHHWDDYGNSFFTDGAGSSGVYHAVPGAMYFTYAGARRELASISPGSYPKFCGLEVVRTPQFPDDWQGDFITCDFRAQRIVRFKSSDSGSSFQTKEMPDLLRTTNVTFRPIDVKFGPDGALYIADWSNPIIQHGEVDFRDPRRDHEHGRIWRVTAKGRPLAKKSELVKASHEQLLRETVSPNAWNREQARVLLRNSATQWRDYYVAHFNIGDLVTFDFSGPGITFEPFPAHGERIKKDGTITMPLIGPVKAAGKSSGELEKEIHDLYVPKYYTRLAITVVKKESSYSVGGEVRQPGPRLYQDQTTLTKAKKSKLTRNGKTTKSKDFEFDVVPKPKDAAAMPAWKKQAEMIKLNVAWMLEGADTLNANFLDALSASDDPNIRAATVRLISHRLDTVPNAIERLAKLVQDGNPRVRLEALRALAGIRSAKSAELALSALAKPMDPKLDYALWLTINDLADSWIAALQSGEWKPEGREKQLEFALKAIEPEKAGRVLSQTLTQRPLTRDGSGPWIELIGSAGSAKELRQLFDQATQGGFDDAAMVRGLKALTDAGRLRQLKPSGDLAAVTNLFVHANESVRTEAMRLAGVWKESGGVLAKLLAVAGDVATPTPVRAVAFESLKAIGGQSAASGLVSLTTPDRDAAVRRQAAATLASVDLGKAVPIIINVLPTLTDESAALEFWRAVLPVKGAGREIAGALPATGIPIPAAQAGSRVAREGGRNEFELVAALMRGSGLASAGTDATASLIKELAAKATEKGNPARGEMIYRRTELACVTCHAIGGAGGKVGPDMTSLGASAQMDYLVESVLLPNSKIKEGYHAVVVETQDGQEFSGTLVRETTQELVLRNATDKETSIAKNNIAKRTVGTLSLMPSGVVENLTESEQLDLFAFLSRLGKPGEFDASKGGVARRWRIYVVDHEDVQLARENRVWTEPLDGKIWIPLFSLVNGRLPISVVSEATKGAVWKTRIAICAATEVQVPRAGRVKLVLTAPGGAELWVDQKKIGEAGESAAELSAGTHRVLVRMDLRSVPEFIRLESPDATFLAQ